MGVDDGGQGLEGRKEGGSLQPAQHSDHRWQDLVTQGCTSRAADITGSCTKEKLGLFSVDSAHDKKCQF